MFQHEALQLGANISWTLFIFAVGACVGSLTNVLVYRLPLGLGVVTQGSRCPACGTPLTWRENIPVLGWLLLRGKCRFCRSPISPEYPMVELLVGLLFASVYVLWYWVPSGYGSSSVFLGVNWAHAAPEWALSDRFDTFPRSTWAPFVVTIVLLGALVAMTLVDAKTFTIPLQIPWFATAVGVLLHPIGAAVIGPLRTSAPGTGWSIPTPGGSFADPAAGWFQIGGVLGAVAGLVLANLLLHFRLLRRSFEDYQQWEDSHRAKHSGPEAADAHSSPMANAAVDPTSQAAGPVGEHAGDGAWRVLRFSLIAIGIIVAIAAVGGMVGPKISWPAWSGLALGIAIAPILAAALNRVREKTVEPGQPSGESAPEVWIQYPHARREMFKELLFLTPCIGLGWLGGILATRFAPAAPPFWLVVLCGSLMGYLVGGGIVWIVRIIGSLAFGKEAMGLGDVHLMAAVGACVGWIDAALAFPLAAFVGLYWVIVSRVGSGSMVRAMPFGPYLALATGIVILGKPLVELGLNAIMPGAPGMPAINLP